MARATEVLEVLVCDPWSLESEEPEEEELCKLFVLWLNGLSPAQAADSKFSERSPDRARTPITLLLLHPTRP